MQPLTRPLQVARGNKYRRIGGKIIPNTAAIAPARMNERRRPNRFHVLSDAEPTIGWTINPMIGATSQNSDASEGAKSEGSNTFAFCWNRIVP